MKGVAKGDMNARLLAFEELATASLTRSIAAVYVVSILQLLIHTQIFELVRMQRLGRVQHEEAQRRFLSIIQCFHLDRNGPGSSLLALLVQRVEAAVRKFYQKVDQSTLCNPDMLASILSDIRRDVESVASLVGECRRTPHVTEIWIPSLIRQLLTDASEALLTPRGADAGAGDAAAGGGAANHLRDSDFVLEARADELVRLQFAALSDDLLEILESDLFAEVCACSVCARVCVLYSCARASCWSGACQKRCFNGYNPQRLQPMNPLATDPSARPKPLPSPNPKH